MVRDLNVTASKEEKEGKKKKGRKKRGVISRILQLTAAIVVIVPILFAVYLFYWEDIKNTGTNVKSGVETNVNKAKDNVKDGVNEDLEKDSSEFTGDSQSFIKESLDKLFK